MSRKDKKIRKRPLGIIEMDYTVLDIVLVGKDGKPTKRPQLFTATNVDDRYVGVGFSMEEAITSLHEWYEKNKKE